MNTKMFKHLMKLPNVVGYSGEAKPRIYQGNAILGTNTLRVYVSKKVPIEYLKPHEVIPKKVCGLNTDVVFIGKLTSTYVRPAPSGCSAIYCGGTACTLGWFGYDKLDGKLVILANNHCAAGENKLPLGHPYVQPSPADGTPEVLGYLKRFVLIQYDNFLCPFRNFFARLVPRRKGNYVDLAMVEVDRKDVLPEVEVIGKVYGKRRGVLGEEVHKYGRTTGYTKGAVLIDNDFYGRVIMGRGTAMFGPCGLVIGHLFSAGGDSSSAVIFKKDNHFAGLLFAGSGTHTLFCHWDLIELEGNVEVYVET